MGQRAPSRNSHAGHQKPPLPSRHQLPCSSIRAHSSSHHMRMSHTGPDTHPPVGRGGAVGSGEDGGENMQRAASATSTWANRESAPERADGAAKCELTQALVHGRRGPHTWALGDCCILGRCPTTHTPHTTPHAHTLRQHIGYERGHPPTQGPHQQSVSRETRAGWWEEVGVDARGHITRGRAPKGTRSLPSRNPAGWGGKDPVRNPITQHEHPQVAMKGVR